MEAERTTNNKALRINENNGGIQDFGEKGKAQRMRMLRGWG
jgi:hypothetical protein